MLRLSYPTATVLSNKIIMNRQVLSSKDSPQKIIKTATFCLSVCPSLDAVVVAVFLIPGLGTRAPCALPTTLLRPPSLSLKFR